MPRSRPEVGVSLNGRVALVTGGARGIGRAIAIGLAQDGADVAIVDKRELDAPETLEGIRAAGRQGRFYKASVDVWEENARVAEEVQRDLGDVSIFVHAAGISSVGRTLAESDPDELLNLFKIHTLAAQHYVALLIPRMRALPRGDVVVISSGATKSEVPNSGPYTMAKAALEALARTLAKEEMKHGIHVNIIAPGITDTRMGFNLVRSRVPGLESIHAIGESQPYGHVCSPEEVAAVARFFVSDAASYVNGQKIILDGGVPPQPMIASPNA
jgi:NAD(P)-dependent dehydrogenase (short-subunit alcohol dehydrogenase family)